MVEAHHQVNALHEVLEALQGRLQFLEQTGLGYLSLGRAYGSLSGGEAQRVRLASQLGMGLVGVTYIMDEPSIGLHPSDNARLIDSLVALRDRGNTVVVVEHDAAMMRAADHLVEMGPGAGEAGGEVVYEGSPAHLVEGACEGQHPHSVTAPYLANEQSIEREASRLCVDQQTAWLRVVGACEHNLKQVDFEVPVGLLTCVCGVSGGGKSTLVNGILAKAAAFRLNGAKAIPGRHERIEGLEHFQRVVRVDQSPIGRSPRSNPATYTKCFDLLRDLYSKCPLSKVRGYKPARFSFNVAGGRCERCRGDGQVALDMQFMGDVYVRCPSCHGARYNRETLEVRYHGLTIADALNLTVDQALEAFARVPRLAARLDTLQQVGLGYVRLGQSATTLSGGEAQRLKLSLELSRKPPVRGSGQTLYLLDEPTTGLHWADIQKLMNLLFQLRDQGHTIVIIEHHTDVLRLADWLVELGPGGGSSGGTITFAGPPEAIAACPESPVLLRQLP